MAGKLRLAIAGVSIVLFLLSGCTVYGGKKNKGWNATGGEALERQFWADVKDKNFDELQKHIAISWVWQTPEGPLDRAASLERFRQMEISDYTLGDFKVTPNGPDMIVTYTASFRGPSVEPTQWKMMTVWQKPEKNWIAIAHAQVR